MNNQKIKAGLNSLITNFRADASRNGFPRIATFRTNRVDDAYGITLIAQRGAISAKIYKVESCPANARSMRDIEAAGLARYTLLQSSPHVACGHLVLQCGVSEGVLTRAIRKLAIQDRLQRTEPAFAKTVLFSDEWIDGKQTSLCNLSHTGVAA